MCLPYICERCKTISPLVKNLKWRRPSKLLIAYEHQRQQAPFLFRKKKKPFLPLVLRFSVLGFEFFVLRKFCQDYSILKPLSTLYKNFLLSKVYWILWKIRQSAKTSRTHNMSFGSIMSRCYMDFRHLQIFYWNWRQFF